MSGIEPADYEWLTGEDAARRLADLAQDSTPVERLAVRLRRELSAPRTHLLLEQVDLRRRARVKFSQADRMFFTRQALEQATDERLAAWKAARFTPAAGAVDLCCGLGGDALGLAAVGPVLAVERDPLVARLAQANADACGAVDLRVVVLDADAALEAAAGLPTDPRSAWHVDPDRRATGRRTTAWEACSPGPATLERWSRWRAAGAIKLAPATELTPAEAGDGEREWLESRGECRQQVLWRGELARHPGRRSATIVDRGEPRTVVERTDERPAPVERPMRYVFEPRPAVFAAGLADSLAVELDARPLGESRGYLTSDSLRLDAAWQPFELLDELPFDRRRLKAAVRERGWGRSVLKSRGVDADLVALARELAGPGAATGVVLLTRYAGRTHALLVRPAAA